MKHQAHACASHYKQHKLRCRWTLACLEGWEALLPLLTKHVHVTNADPSSVLAEEGQ